MATAPNRSEDDEEDASRLVTRELLQRPPLAERGRRLLGEVAADCRSDEATLWTLSADGLHLEGALNHGRTPAIMERLSVPAADSVVGLVAFTGQPTCIGPDDAHHKGADLATQTVTRAMAATPVFVRRQLCGVLSTINPRDATTFAPDVLGILQWKAYLIGLVIEDALAGR